MSLCVVFVGATRHGKTTEAIKFAKSFQKVGVDRIIVNDVRREYKYRIDKTITKYRGEPKGYIDLMNFFNVLAANTVFIVEDASPYVPHAGSNPRFIEPLASKGFNGNIYILNFHALRQIPEYLMDYVDVIFIKKSRGRMDKLKLKFGDYPEILEAWKRVNASNFKYEMERVDL